MNKAAKLNNRSTERKFLMQNLQVNAFSDISRYLSEKLTKSKKHQSK